MHLVSQGTEEGFSQQQPTSLFIFASLLCAWPWNSTQ